MEELKELKLNDNKIMSLPEILKENQSLEILDVGSNEIKDIKFLILSQSGGFTSVGLKKGGCAVTTPKIEEHQYFWEQSRF